MYRAPWCCKFPSSSYKANAATNKKVRPEIMNHGCSQQLLKLRERSNFFTHHAKERGKIPAKLLCFQSASSSFDHGAYPVVTVDYERKSIKAS